MKNKLPIPPNEGERLKALHRYNVLDSLPEEEYDSITSLAARICDVPIALISIVSEDRQWFKSKVGLDATETSRDLSFCQYAIMDKETFVVEDATKDARFAENPLVTADPSIRFYAGHPIDDNEGHNLGTLCVIDRKPRVLTPEQTMQLKRLAQVIKSLIILRYQNSEFVAYEKLFNYSQDMLCIAGTDTYFKKLNPAFTNILGWSEEELMSKPFLDFVHPDDIENTLKEVEQLSTGKPTVAFRNRYRKKDGSYAWMHWTSTPDKKTGDLYAVAHDISDMVETNAKLNRAISHKETFLSNMSHEVRTPMNAIKGFAELLQSTPLNDEQQDYLETISLASDNLLVVINDILDVSKIESGKIALDEKPFSVKDIVEQVVKLTRKKASKKSLKIITSVDHEIPRSVIGDPVRLTQILVNLIGNGIKFTEKGRIEVKVLVEQLSGDSATISFAVSDTGIGIPKDKLDHIFERFEQASKDTTRQYGGTGLGLSIVKMLVELHDGTIQVFSAKGKGSEFSFQITYPIAESMEVTTNILEQEDVHSDLLTNVYVLIAEDNEMNQKLAENYLKKHGASIEVAVNGKLAVDKVKNSKYDVVIMDLQMPEMDGYQATQEIRTVLNMDIPIIACTAHSLVGEKRKCLEVGMNGYVSKPYTEKELINSVFQVLPESSRKSKERLSGIRADIRTKIAELEEQEGKEFVNSLMDIYNTRIPVDLEALKQALKIKDYDLMKEKAHLVASSLTALYFKRGYQISKNLETAIVENNLIEVDELCFELIEYLGKSLKVTQNYNSIS